MGRVTRQLRGKEGLILEHKGPPNWRMEIKPQLISDVRHWWERVISAQVPVRAHLQLMVLHAQVPFYLNMRNLKSTMVK